ncbi:hypothetical protein PInf_019990 [Phytophthora infestans]|nr:hypothetical protein PInf_019990 [Phytophthora infestans]
MKKDRDALQQRAYFFLYYWLLKRSLNQLGRYTLVKKRDRLLTVKIMKANRHRILIKTMQNWRLRLQLLRVFTLWKSYVRRRHQQALLYGPIAEALKHKTHHRLLLFMFAIWEEKHAQTQAQHALVRIVDRHLYRKIVKERGKRGKLRHISLLKWSLVSVAIKSDHCGEYGMRGVLEHEKKNCANSKDVEPDSMDFERGMLSDNLR